MLKKLRAALKKHEKDAYAAYKKDYNKGMLETTAYEFAVVYAELDEAILNLKQWMGVKKNKVPLFSIPGRGERYRDPYGVVLIVSPWNFPHNLTFCPLIGAIAGGNCAVLKPSNYTPTISKVIKETVEEAFPENYITVVTGGREENAQLFDQYFNMAFFTGGTTVAKVLSEKCAKHVTPVILELGGKSPVYIDREVDMKERVASLTWGKFANGGQICVCPDYILVHEKVHDKFVKELISCIKKHQTDKKGKLRSNFTSLVSEKHFDKVLGLIDEDKVIYRLQEPNRKEKQIGPVVLDGITLQDKCMQEEIFGPLIPILTVKSKEEAVELIHKEGHVYNGSDGAQPLALYVYTTNKKTAQYLIDHVQSGGCTVNGTIFHFLGVRFNGVGFSGNSDGYHGIASFLAFTHGRSVLRYDRMTALHRLIIFAAWQRPVTDRLLKAVTSVVPLSRLWFPILKGDCEEKSGHN